MAEKQYRKVLEQGEPAENNYFIPNSCLQLGILLEKSDRREEARQLFEKVLEYENFPFETAIKRKAKAHLSGFIQGQ